LLRMILNNEVSKVLIAYPNRLARFEMLEEVCRAHNCEIACRTGRTKLQDES
jgi:Predicted site-specific integrase-resolvase